MIFKSIKKFEEKETYLPDLCCLSHIYDLNLENNDHFHYRVGKDGQDSGTNRKVGSSDPENASTAGLNNLPPHLGDDLIVRQRIIKMDQKVAITLEIVSKAGSFIASPDYF